MNTLTVTTLDRETRVRTAARQCSWFRSRWFLLSLGGVTALAVFTGLLTGAPAAYDLGQIILGLSVYISLSFLADRFFSNTNGAAGKGVGL